jgi:hypothetical protein
MSNWSISIVVIVLWCTQYKLLLCSLLDRKMIIIGCLVSLSLRLLQTVFGNLGNRNVITWQFIVRLPHISIALLPRFLKDL